MIDDLLRRRDLDKVRHFDDARPISTISTMMSVLHDPTIASGYLGDIPHPALVFFFVCFYFSLSLQKEF
jgi:hypothetical protein